MAARGEIDRPGFFLGGGVPTVIVDHHRAVDPENGPVAGVGVEGVRAALGDVDVPEEPGRKVFLSVVEGREVEVIGLTAAKGPQHRKIRHLAPLPVRLQVRVVQAVLAGLRGILGAHGERHRIAGNQILFVPDPRVDPVDVVRQIGQAEIVRGLCVIFERVVPQKELHTPHVPVRVLHARVHGHVGAPRGRVCSLLLQRQ